MNAWLKSMGELSRGMLMLHGYVATTRGLRALGTRAEAAKEGLPATPKPLQREKAPRREIVPGPRFATPR